MKMKITILGLSVLILTGITGCTDWLTIKPESQVVLGEFWQSETDVQEALAGCYRQLTVDDNIYRMIIWGELRSDNMIASSNIGSSTSGSLNEQDIKYILNGNITPTNSYASWGSIYTVINYCNTLLFYAPEVMQKDVNFTTDHFHKVQAEALTLRALCYFYLVRTYKEVPYITAASINNTQNYSYAKAPEDTIISHIITDLKIAQQYAVTDFGRTDYNKGRITLDAVNSLLADVYLWKGDYANCSQTCDLVLADSRLKLVEAATMYSQVFYLGNSTESIFELQFAQNVQVNNPVIKLYGSSSNITGDLAFPVALAYNQLSGTAAGADSPFDYKVTATATESTNDIRAKDSYMLNGGYYYIFKYAGIQVVEATSNNVVYDDYFYRSNTANWIVYRLSDVQLMKAEALVELDGASNLNNAISMVNATYLRSNPGQDSLQISNYNSKSAMESLVLRERQRELLFEGKRWFDLVRVARREGNPSTLNTYVQHKSVGANSAALNAPVLDALYLPISQSELQANPNLIQNPYYQVSTTISN